MDNLVASLPLIPYPQSVEQLDGSLVWSREVGIFRGAYEQEVELFVAGLPQELRPEVVDGEAESQLRFVEDPNLPDEGYELAILPDESIEIWASSRTGVFYALQSLRQLIMGCYQTGKAKVVLDCVRIQDAPRFGWRGFMLDEARHFQGMQTVKDLLDWMAYLKMNVFHWHLTEDQGWRIEIKRYPKLVEVGSKRDASQISGFLGKKLNAIPHSGFYSQGEIREIVQYAAARHIRVVPEIEMPGHSTAALAAYPELGCKGGPYQVSPHWGIHADILCAGKQNTTEFLQNVLAEVIDLFPGKYIHMGGDEAPKKRWRNCPECQRLARESGDVAIPELQTVLTNRISQFLRDNSRNLIGWNEILVDNLDPEAVVQYWVGKEKTVMEHIRNGRKAILSNFAAFYLDHSYAHSSLDKVYLYEPVFAQLEREYHGNILGIEAPLWTEFVPSRARLDWQVFPRLLAVAEAAWLAAEKKDLCSFHERLPAFLAQMDQKNIGYAKLSDANPPFYNRIFGALSIIQAGRGQRREFNTIIKNSSKI